MRTQVVLIVALGTVQISAQSDAAFTRQVISDKAEMWWARAVADTDSTSRLAPPLRNV